MTILVLIVGLTVLTVGAEMLVRGASALAAAARISPLVIGLTVVAYGTSAPEMVVSLQASLRGQADIALGNVVGSNIFNVLFILGISALIVPLVVSQQLVRFDVPVMIALSVLVWGMAYDGKIGRLDGVLLFLGVVAYTVWAIVQSRKEQKAIQEEYAKEFGAPTDSPPTAGRILLDIVMVVAGLGLLVFGSRLFSDAAIDVARTLGVSELVIGLTIVAAGTSLPEVATSIMAAIRGERDIAVGNVVGSNIFNIMAVLGLSSAVAADGISVPQAAFRFDIPVMTAVAVACLPIFFTGHLIARWEGALFFGYYIAYTTYLILTAVESEMTRGFEVVMIWFVIPLTVITLLVGLRRAMQIQKA